MEKVLGTIKINYSKISFNKIREFISFILLLIWITIPILKEVRQTCEIAILYEYTFIKIVGAIGLLFLISDIYINSKKIKDKKIYDKEILPITILGIFMIWTLISSLCSKNIENAFLGTDYRKDGYITYLAYAGFFSCAFFIRSKTKMKILINMFMCISILNIIIVDLCNKGILTQLIAQRNIKSTCFFNSNHYGYYLMLATITANFLFVTEKNKILKIIYLFAYTFLLYYLIKNDTMGCYIAIAATLILFMIYCIINKKKRIVTIISIIIFLSVSFINSEVKKTTVKNINNLVKDINSVVESEQVKNKEVENKEQIVEIAARAGSGRIRIWKYGIEFFIQKPILGYGPENLEVKYKEVGINQDRPHNLLIQLATTSGIIGLVTYIGAIGIILIRALKSLNIENKVHTIVFANAIAYLISAMFGNSMYYTSPYFFIFLGLLMYENILNKNNKEGG